MYLLLNVSVRCLPLIACKEIIGFSFCKSNELFFTDMNKSFIVSYCMDGNQNNPNTVVVENQFTI